MNRAALSGSIPVHTKRAGRLGGNWQASQFLLVAILLGITFAFRAGLNYFFVQDDFAFLARLAQARTPVQWLGLFLMNDHFYRPFARVVLLGIPFGIFQTSPLGYHVFNLSLHLVNTLLVFRLLKSLKTTALSAALGAGLYGFYPAHLTPLVWISGIQELSVALMILLTSLAFLAWSRQPRRLRYYGLSLVCYAIALLCKETAVLLPVWLVLVQARYQRSGEATGRRLIWLVPAQTGFALVALGYAAVRFVKANVTGDTGPYTISLAPLSLWQNTQAYVLDAFGMRSIQIVSPGVLAAATALGLLILVIALGPQRWRGVAGLVWCLCFLAPTLILLNRHYTYYFSVATVGVAIFVSAVADRLIQFDKYVPTPSRRRLAALLPVLALLAWASYAAIRISEPIDEQSLKAKGERARQIVAALQAQYPQSIPCSTLVVTGASGNQAELGEMFVFFYPTLGQVVFDNGPALPNPTSTTAGECHFELPAALSFAQSDLSSNTGPV